MVAKAFRPSAARRPDPGRGEGSGHKRSRNQRRGAPRDSWRERQSQFAPPARRTVTPKVTPTNAAASSTASRLKERCAASPRIIVPIIVSKDDLALNTLSREAGRELCRIAAPCFFDLTRFSRNTVPTLWSASVHHRRFEYADHRGVRWLPAQVADAMRHIAPIAQRLAAAGRRRRFADLDLEFPVQNR